MGKSEPDDDRRSESFKQKIKIIHQNAQIATNKIDELDLACKEINPDVFIVSEHGFRPETINFFKIENYELAKHFCRTSLKGGGVAVFVKKPFIYEPYKLNYSCDLHFEATGIKIMSKLHGKIAVIGLYRSPNGCGDTFFEKLDLLLNSLFFNSSKFILIGDLNINVKDQTSPLTQRLRDVLNSFGLKWSVNSPTRVTATTSTAIDNVITNIPNTIVSVLNAAVSDHFAQEVLVQGFLPKSHKSVVKTTRTVNPQNIFILNKLLNTETWEILDGFENIDDMFSVFNCRFNYYLDVACPYKTKKLNQRPMKKSWITKGILVSRQKLKFYHSIFIRTQNENFKTFFRNYRRVYKKVIRAAKAYDINKSLKHCTHFSKTAWKIINESTSSKQSKNNLKPLSIKVEDTIIKDSFQVANEFNKYFSSIPAFNLSVTKPVSPVTDFNLVSSMALAPVSEEEIVRVMQKLRSKRSCDANGMSTWLLKQCFRHILTPLTKLINLSFSTGLFPSLLKTAKIVPIFKKDNPLLASNYRPISILPVFSKVFEKVFCERLQSFLEHHDILSPAQYGFRKNKSTIDAVNNLLENVVDGLERREQVLSIFLDLSKAFDCVHHETLLHQLEKCGVRGLPHRWLRSYLKDRDQCVQILDVLSDKIDTSQGVPQGSILGPLLFLVYINRLNTVALRGNVIQYADDTTLCFRARSVQELEIKSFLDVNTCIQYLSELNLKINSSKSNVMPAAART